jgi:hypothetical protein
MENFFKLKLDKYYEIYNDIKNKLFNSKIFREIDVKYAWMKGTEKRFVSHGEKHIKNLLSLYFKICSKNQGLKNMDPIHIYIMLLSILFHDIGLYFAKIGKIEDLFKDQTTKKVRQIHNFLSGYFIEYDDNIFDNELKNIKDFINEKLKLDADSDNLKRIIATIIRYHSSWVPINNNKIMGNKYKNSKDIIVELLNYKIISLIPTDKLDNMFIPLTKLDSKSYKYKNKQINIKFLISLLRILDEADGGFQRFEYIDIKNQDENREYNQDEYHQKKHIDVLCTDYDNIKKSIIIVPYYPILSDQNLEFNLKKDINEELENLNEFIKSVIDSVEIYDNWGCNIER